MRCFCGRRAAYAATASGWALEATFTPEASVPIQGFSRELKLAWDVEKFWFLHPIGGANLPVHVIFSPTLRVAEIKAADQKALRMENAVSISEARGIWVERRESLRRTAREAKRPTGSLGEKSGQSATVSG